MAAAHKSRFGLGCAAVAIAPGRALRRGIQQGRGGIRVKGSATGHGTARVPKLTRNGSGTRERSVPVCKMTGRQGVPPQAGTSARNDPQKPQVGYGNQNKVRQEPRTQHPAPTQRVVANREPSRTSQRRLRIRASPWFGSEKVVLYRCSRNRGRSAELISLMGWVSFRLRTGNACLFLRGRRDGLRSATKWKPRAFRATPDAGCPSHRSPTGYQPELRLVLHGSKPTAYPFGVALQE